jgi:hypothetical protein
MPVFCLAPIDPSDDAWKGAAFVQRIWVEAIDEPAARAQATAITRPYSHIACIRGRVRHWPWIFAATCEVDADHPGVSPGRALTEDGRLLGP